jgi:glycosidase
MHEDESIFAYTRKYGNKKATVLINFTDKEASYDAGLVKNAKCILSSDGEAENGSLSPYEAVIYED